MKYSKCLNFLFNVQREASFCYYPEIVTVSVFRIYIYRRVGKISVAGLGNLLCYKRIGNIHSFLGLKWINPKT